MGLPELCRALVVDILGDLDSDTLAAILALRSVAPPSPLPPGITPEVVQEVCGEEEAKDVKDIVD